MYFWNSKQTVHVFGFITYWDSLFNKPYSIFIFLYIDSLHFWTISQIRYIIQRCNEFEFIGELSMTWAKFHVLASLCKIFDILCLTSVCYLVNESLLGIIQKIKRVIFPTSCPAHLFVLSERQKTPEKVV